MDCLTSSPSSQYSFSYYVQIRMIAAIEHMRGYDLKDDQVKTFVFICLTSKSASYILKKAGIKAGARNCKTGYKENTLEKLLIQ